LLIVFDLRCLITPSPYSVMSRDNGLLFILDKLDR
jgi:hypothetical protein